MPDGVDEALLKFLAKHGCIEPGSAASAREHARANKVTILEALCESGVTDEEAIADLFHQALRLPRASFTDENVRPPKGLDLEMLKFHLAVPAAMVNGRMVLAMANPFDHEVLRTVSFASGLRAIPAVATLSEVRAALARAAGADAVPIERMSIFADDPATAASASPIVKMASLLVEQAITLRASDIHMEPTNEGLTVRYRIDGSLEEATRLSPAVRAPLVARLKVMARLDIAERRVPQDGGLSLNVDGRAIDCRVSTLPTQYGEKVVVRILDAKSALVGLDQLGFAPGELSPVEECLHQPEGMILTTGPTGSGKSTTLYAMLQAIRSSDVNIVTVENPIEYRLAGINQTEVQERQGMTFAAALRSILRQDPDVILVGEIRDRETAEIAIQAAQTGHLVLSTLHTNDSVGAVIRLMKLGIDRELIASSLLLVIAQRLVRATCPACGESTPVSAWNDSPLRSKLGDQPLLRGRGCPDCRNTGYRGRVGVYEIFRNSTEARRLISDGANEVDLREMLRRQGGRTLMQVAVEKIRAGRTTPEEVAQAIKADEHRHTCPGCGAHVDELLNACSSCGLVLRRVCVSCLAPLPEGHDRCAVCGTDVAGNPPPEPVLDLTPTSIELVAPKSMAVGSVLGAGVRGLCAAGGLDEAAAGELELAVVEACGLACAAGVDSELRVVVELSPDGYSVCLSDEGAAWAWPRPSARPPDLETIAAMGGPEVRAFLIRSSVDEASYERSERTNRLWLIKRPSTALDNDAILSANATAPVHH